MTKHTGRDIVVIGASAGGIEAVSALVSGLPVDLGAARFVVVQTTAESPGYMGKMFDDAGPLRRDLQRMANLYAVCPRLRRVAIAQPGEALLRIRNKEESA